MRIDKLVRKKELIRKKERVGGARRKGKYKGWAERRKAEGNVTYQEKMEEIKRANDFQEHLNEQARAAMPDRNRGVRHVLNASRIPGPDMKYFLTCKFY